MRPVIRSLAMRWQMIRWSLFVSLLATALCSMLLWGLVVLGHPARWTIDGVLISVAYAGVAATICSSCPRSYRDRLLARIAAVAWLLLLASGALDYMAVRGEDGITQPLARLALGWLWLVLPFFLADSAARPRDDRRTFSIWLLLCVGFVAFARALVGPAMLHGEALRTWAPLSLIVLALSPFALTYGFARQEASRPSAG